MDFWRFTAVGPEFGSPLAGSYDLTLVALSIFIACAAGLTTLLMADRMVAAESARSRRWWHGFGAVVIGLGIWGMHFTGMLAYHLPIHMGYDLQLTLLSVLPAMIGGAAALHVVSKSRFSTTDLQAGAILLAIGIGTMHYTGMEAMNLAGVLRYDVSLFALSLVVAYLLALLAVYVRIGLRRFTSVRKGLVLTAIAAPFIGSAIVGMHYIAMAAARIYEAPEVAVHGFVFPHAMMGGMIGAVVVIILTGAMVAVWASQQSATRRMLEDLAHTDALTGLPNRALLNKQLDHAAALCARRGNRLAVLFLDLDDFKAINDSLGHEAGDWVLVEVAKRLRVTVRSADTVGRFGGDEFVIIAEELVSIDDAAEVAEKVATALAEPVRYGEWNLSARASIGISVFPDDGKSARDLIQHADSAMYKAKGQGGAWHYYNSAYSDDAMERVWLGVELREALRVDGLTVYYQPLVDLRTGNWVGVEALARWPHATGFISPARFIPVAERTGMIFDLGSWVLRECCKQARAWMDANIGFGRIAFNVSVAELKSPHLPKRIRELLIETSIPGECLEMEITESSLIDPDVIGRLQEIRDLGVTLSVDDFGTGYSSLSYLRILSVDKVKIDRTFIQNVTEDPRDHAIIRAVIQMGISLGFSVVAEGIETDAQRQALVGLGCGLGQGYLFLRPSDVDEVARAYTAQHRPRLEKLAQGIT